MSTNANAMQHSKQLKHLPLTFSFRAQIYTGIPQAIKIIAVSKYDNPAAYINQHAYIEPITLVNKAAARPVVMCGYSPSSHIFHNYAQLVKYAGNTITPVMDSIVFHALFEK